MTQSNDQTALHWYVAYVRSCQEKKVAQALENLGIEHYLAIKKVRRQWSDRVKIMDQLVIPRVIFVRTDSAGRLLTLESVRGISRYLTENGPYTPSIVPDKQMDAFRRMVEYSSLEVGVVPAHFAKGDKVKVISGPLSGYEYELVEVEGRKCLAVSLGVAGTAMIEFSTDLLKKI